VSVEIGQLQADVARLKSDVAALEKENRELRALLNRGRGAVWVLGLGAGLATFALSQWRHMVDFLK